MSFYRKKLKIDELPITLRKKSKFRFTSGKKNRTNYKCGESSKNSVELRSSRHHK